MRWRRVPATPSVATSMIGHIATMNFAVVFVFQSLRRCLTVLTVLVRVPAVGIGKDVSPHGAQPLADVLEKSFVWHQADCDWYNGFPSAA